MQLPVAVGRSLSAALFCCVHCRHPKRVELSDKLCGCRRDVVLIDDDWNIFLFVPLDGVIGLLDHDRHIHSFRITETGDDRNHCRIHNNSKCSEMPLNDRRRPRTPVPLVRWRVYLLLRVGSWAVPVSSLEQNSSEPFRSTVLQVGGAALTLNASRQTQDDRSNLLFMSHPVKCTSSLGSPNRPHSPASHINLER